MLNKIECYEATPEDWNQIAAYLLCFGMPITFSYSKDKITCHIITLAPFVVAISQIAWGGNVNDMAMLSVRRKGVEFFPLRDPEPIHWSYIADKLNLPEPDAEAVAELFNEIKYRILDSQFVETAHENRKQIVSTV